MAKGLCDGGWPQSFASTKVGVHVTLKTVILLTLAMPCEGGKEAS